MMMPANYSVIAENEMTYVNGGANAFIDAIGAVTAPIWTLENVKTFNTNLVTIIGNKFLGGFVNGTLGTIFSGNCTWGDFKAIPGALVGADKFKAGQYGDGIAQILGTAAAIYNLGTATTANKATSAAISGGAAEKLSYTTTDGGKTWTLIGKVVG